MLENRNQVIVSGLLSLSFIGLCGAVALPFDNKIEFKIGNRIESRPAWLVPPKAEFKGIERGYGGIKITLALLGAGGMWLVMLIARSEGKLEPVRQRIKKYQEKAYEFGFAAESAYQMSTLANRYKKLADADEVAFEGEIEAAYMESLGIDPNAQQPLLTGTATLESISNPGDKVDPSVAPAELTEGPKLPKLTNYPAVLIYGPQGSGKTFLAEEEIRERKQAGHKVTALDPHAGFNSWRDCEVIGAGMDYPAIDAELASFAAEVKRRYERIRKEPNPQFQPWTFVCDEFTNWASRCKASGDFFQAALSDIRKAKLYVLFVSHARTLAGLGDAKGMAATRDSALLEIELLGQIDPVTTEAVPKFEALVKLPGQSQADRTLVKLVKHPEPKNATVADVSDAQIDTPDTPSRTDTTLPEQESGNLPNPYGKGTAGTQDTETSSDSEALEQSLNGFLAEVLAESLPPIFADDFPLKKHDRRVQLAKLVIAKNLGKQKTIFLLWGVTDGGRNHQRYVDARDMLDRLIKGEEGNAN
ncbi:ATP-binding protein [Microcoleus sp. AT9b-C5]|uniref:ATP-binding protein n=1 Tax=unclassified Microcoleus TaxID=2642155 RepID=UPI002FD1ABA0